MRNALLVFTLAFAPAAFADASLPTQAAVSAAASSNASLTHRGQVLARYCDKLREGPEEYARFVRRMATVYGYTYADFAPEKQGDDVKAQCRTLDGQMASRGHPVLR
jgi:hypothetical protein